MVFFNINVISAFIFEELHTFMLCCYFMQMEKIVIQKTSKTPSVAFDPEQGVFEMRGKSIPENSHNFYGPLLDYVERYGKRPAERTIFSVRFEFFNTSSTNRIHALFKRFEKIFLDDRDVLIRWYCETGDESMRDAGRDFRTILQVPFEIVEVDEL